MFSIAASTFIVFVHPSAIQCPASLLVDACMRSVRAFVILAGDDKNEYCDEIAILRHILYSNHQSLCSVADLLVPAAIPSFNSSGGPIMVFDGSIEFFEP